jgi:tRNA (adenine37-N6)-methyltransferase
VARIVLTEELRRVLIVGMEKFSDAGKMESDCKNRPEMRLHPVGVVRSGIKKPMLQAGKADIAGEERNDQDREFRRKVQDNVCELIIFSEWEELLEGIEGFSHILVLYWPHLIDPERRKLKRVHPMGRKDLPEQGIFATCSPARPNPVLVTAVPLLGRIGNILKVKGLEAIDGSPIIDIKPYVRHYHFTDTPTVPEWMEKT